VRFECETDTQSANKSFEEEIDDTKMVGEKSSGIEELTYETKVRAETRRD
jgi:hypothetical protein